MNNFNPCENTHNNNRRSDPALHWIAEMSTDQDLIGLDQDWSQFWPDWIGLQFFWKLADEDWVGLRNILLFRCDYSEHIKNFSCDPILQIC